MRSNKQTKLIRRIHAAGKQIVLAVTGGASGAIAALLEVPGASASVLEAVVPYAERALADWLGGAPDSFCNERTARAMAMAAFERARNLTAGDPKMLVGIGVTASLISGRPKRGAHRIHVAWQSAEATVAISCVLSKGQRNRAEEEALATALALDAVAEATGIASSPLSAGLVDEPVKRREKHAPSEWTELLLGARAVLEISVNHSHVNDPISSSRASTARQVIFPGAFNPIHVGHERIAEIAASICGAPVFFELSLTNVDKPSLDFLELDDRIDGLAGKNVLVTRAPTFVEKAQLLPGSIFAVGTDTISRIADSRYYEGDLARRDAAISSIAAAGCRFLVFGRSMDDQFQTLTDFDLPAPLLAICDQVPESTFRTDVSSTELRHAKLRNIEEKT